MYVCIEYKGQKTLVHIESGSSPLSIDESIQDVFEQLKEELTGRVVALVNKTGRVRFIIVDIYF
jgi:hypothetical protein